MRGGANFAEGDGRDEGDDGDSSGSTFCRGEISECGDALALGETNGFGETVTLGALLGVAEGFAEVKDGEGDAVVFLNALQLNEVLEARAVSMLPAVSTSPPLKVPSVLFAGSVAVGGWPTGIGS